MNPGIYLHMRFHRWHVYVRLSMEHIKNYVRDRKWKKYQAQRVMFILNNRRTGSFTGILDVLSFDVGEILLETELGMLDLKGKDLHVNRLNLEKGEADIEGEIDMITYSKVPEVTGKKDKMFGRIFR